MWPNPDSVNARARMFEEASRHSAPRRSNILSARWSALLVQAALASILWQVQVEAQCIDYGDYLHHVGQVDTPDHANSVAVSGNYAYVADTVSGLLVIDVTNPQSPQLVGGVDTPDDARGVAISGTYAYVADGLSGLQVIDITNPQSPQLGGSVNTPGFARGVAVSGTNVYLADQLSLLIAPTQCLPVVSVLLSSFALSHVDDVVEVRWEVRTVESGAEFRLTASRGEEGWEVPVDPQAGPGFAAFDRSPRLAEGGDVHYRLLYGGPGEAWRVLAEQTIALGTTGAPTRLFEPYPNPANALIVVPFSSGRGGRALVTVHDVAGREVARVFEGRVRPGAGQWVWSVADARGGAKLAAGVYVVRLATESGVQARKVVLVE